MLGWLHDGSPGETGSATAAAGRAAILRARYDEIGDFLFANGLEPTPRNYAVAHGYLSGEDWQVARAVADHLGTGQPLSERAIAEIIGQQRDAELTPERLAAMASQLEAQLDDCVAAVDTTRDSTATFGSALDKEAANLASDPAGTLHRVIAVTRDAVETTRMVEAQLRQTRREADALRSDLEQARRAADQDHLTGLPNRRCFEARLAELMAREEEKTVTVAICDIDDFKQVNDRHGHTTGDRVLRFFGDFLRTHLAQGAMVARLGGEEFGCLFDGGTPHAAREALDAVRQRLATRSLVNQDNGLPIGRIAFSAGVAPITGRNSQEAIQQADAALYAAKRNGKDAVVVARL